MADGEAALAAVAAHRPDLVLLDVMMPGLDGYEVCRSLKADPTTMYMPVVMLTALQEAPDRLRGLEAGADEILSKPCNTTEPLVRVRSLLRMKTLHDRVTADKRSLGEKVAERTVALERAVTQLQEVDRLKSAFLANVSHELRTPLTPVLGYLPSFLREEFGPLTPRQREILGHIGSSVDRLHRLIEDLLTFTRWESGEAGLHLGAVAVENVIAEGVAGVAALAREKGVETRVDFPAALPPVWADPRALGRAVGHLIENAVSSRRRAGRSASRRVPSALRVVLRETRWAPGTTCRSRRRLPASSS